MLLRTSPLLRAWLPFLSLVVLQSSLFAAVEWGIANNYPGDANIKNDPAVVFVEDFESRTLSGLRTNWSYIRHEDRMHFSNEKPTASSGLSSLHIGADAAGLGGVGADLFKQFGTDYKQLYLRFYVKYDAATCEHVHHASWIGGYKNHDNSYWGYAGWANPPTTAFSAGLEPIENFARWDMYSYYATMKQSNDGVCWGNIFGIFNSKLATHRGQWECIESMIKMNTHPDSTNGEVAGWINGEKVLHLGKGFPVGRWATGGGWTTLCRDASSCAPFPGFKWSQDPTFAINWLFLEHYIDTDPGQNCQVLYDNVVVAKNYIGPIPGSVAIGSSPSSQGASIPKAFSWRCNGNAIQFALNTDQAGPLEFDVFSLEGKKVWSYRSVHFASGRNHISWQTANKPEGIFLVKAKTADRTFTHRVAAF